MKKVWKRLGIVAAMLALTGMLAGCGGKDNVGVVDMSRVQKEAPLVQQYKQKTEDKQKSIEKELQDAQQSMSAEDFQKKQQQAQQDQQKSGPVPVIEFQQRTAVIFPVFHLPSSLGSVVTSIRKNLKGRLNRMEAMIKKIPLFPIFFVFLQTIG